jgi:hypothetical protein
MYSTYVKVNHVNSVKEGSAVSIPVFRLQLHVLFFKLNW